MIHDIGIDAVEIQHMKEALSYPNFKKFTFSEREIRNEHGDEVTYYATRFACKEAVFIALNMPIDLRRIETLNKENGKPYVASNQYITPEMADRIHISITTEKNIVVAFCIVEMKGK